MASAWIKVRLTAAGHKRFRVEYRLGGRESAVKYGGQFETKREALTRKAYVAGELAAMRVPALGALAAPPPAITVAVAAERWQASRVDVSENTRLQHRSSVRLILGALQPRAVDAITPQDVADAVGVLHAAGKKRQTIRKAVTALAMILDHAGVTPNPGRDKVAVRLPREEVEEMNPPTADHVEGVYRLLPARHRLGLLWLDWSGARVGSIDGLRICDYDESSRRIRIPAAISKTRRALWVELHPVLARAIDEAIGPREDRNPDGLLFAGSGSAAMRTAIGKACVALAIPPWSPHDLRHRRISLLHKGQRSWAEIGQMVGQRNLAVTANTYTHVMLDAREVDYANLLGAVT